VISLHIQEDAPGALQICAVAHTADRRRPLPVGGQWSTEQNLLPRTFML
jgi:hypothetical protein